MSKKEVLKHLLKKYSPNNLEKSLRPLRGINIQTRESFILPFHDPRDRLIINNKKTRVVTEALKK